MGVVSTAKCFAPFALAAFRRCHPGIDLGLTIANRAMTIEALRQYDLDFAITGRPPDDLPVETEKIGDHPHVVTARPDHRLARGRWSPAALTAETFLMRGRAPAPGPDARPRSGTRALAARLFAEAGVTPRIGMAIDSNKTIEQAVMAGLGIALLSAHATAAELADGRLLALDIDGLPAMREWFVVRHAEKHLLPAAAALWRFLAGEGAAYLPVLPATRSRRAGPDRRGITADGRGR